MKLRLGNDLLMATKGKLGTNGGGGEGVCCPVASKNLAGGVL
jgi:hypothetical protein